MNNGRKKATPKPRRPDPLPRLTEIQRERLCHFCYLRDLDPLGNAPTIRNLHQRLGVSHRAMWETFDQLVEHGCVERGNFGFSRETEVGRECYESLRDTITDLKRDYDPAPLHGQ